MLKKGKKTHQSPSSKTKADEERKNWSRFYFFYYYFFFFGTVSTEDWSFGAGRQAMVPVQMKVYQRRQKKKKKKNKN